MNKFKPDAKSIGTEKTDKKVEKDKKTKKTVVEGNFRRREKSEPTLNPKFSGKVINDEKKIKQNGSTYFLNEKKNKLNTASFKKKNIDNVELCSELQEIREIRN